MQMNSNAAATPQRGASNAHRVQIVGSGRNQGYRPFVGATRDSPLDRLCRAVKAELALEGCDDAWEARLRNALRHALDPVALQYPKLHREIEGKVSIARNRYPLLTDRDADQLLQECERAPYPTRLQASVVMKAVAREHIPGDKAAQRRMWRTMLRVMGEHAAATGPRAGMVCRRYIVQCGRSTWIWTSVDPTWDWLADLPHAISRRGEAPADEARQYADAAPLMADHIARLKRRPWPSAAHLVQVLGAAGLLSPSMTESEGEHLRCALAHVLEAIAALNEV